LPARAFDFEFYQNFKFSRKNNSQHFSGIGDDAASNNETNIKEEPVDPLELRRLQQLTANGQFLNGNYQFSNVNGNGTSFTSLTPASVLHHQSHVPGLKC
jgi:hypothetical protein